jgi:hypothetical protein
MACSGCNASAMRSAAHARALVQRRQATTPEKKAGLDDAEKRLDAVLSGKNVSAVPPESPSKVVQELWSTPSADHLCGVCLRERERERERTADDLSGMCVCERDLPMTSGKYLHGRAFKLKAPPGTSFLLPCADRAVAPLQRWPSTQCGTLQSTQPRQVRSFRRGGGFCVSLRYFWPWFALCQ